MRSTLHGPEEFLLKSKKPRIIALLADIDNMSVDDINRLDERPSIKSGLINIKKSNARDISNSAAETFADIMIAKYHPELLKLV